MLGPCGEASKPIGVVSAEPTTVVTAPLKRSICPERRQITRPSVVRRGANSAAPDGKAVSAVNGGLRGRDHQPPTAGDRLEGDAIGGVDADELVVEPRDRGA